jgi:hypothetical protein
LIPQKSTAEWTRIVHEEADKIRGFELNESGLVNLFLKKGVYTYSRPVAITRVVCVVCVWCRVCVCVSCVCVCVSCVCVSLPRSMLY